MIPWRSVEKDGFPPSHLRVLAVQASPTIGTQIVHLYGRDFDGTGICRERYVTHWCPTTEIEIPDGVPPVQAAPAPRSEA